MNTMKSFTPVLFALAVMAGCGRPEPPQLVPEATDFSETSRYDDVMEVVDYAREYADNMHYEVFGQSEQGKDLPLLVFSDRVIESPREARGLNRPVVFIVANIHSGEVEGKEALLRLILELTDGRHGEWLDNVTLLLAPIYNADGNDMIDRSHRTNQWGPSGGVGTRANAEGLNLNRDFTKLDTSEGQGLVSNVLADWDPMLFMDLHTTNGSRHGYHLTYAEPLNPNTDPMIRRFQREQMLPEIRSAMKEKGWEVFYYGNFYRGGPENGWYTYSHLPRYSSNYHGLRNRMGLLSETYAYVGYESRIEVVEDFVKETIGFMADNAVEIQAMKTVLDANYSQHADTLRSGIAFDYTEDPAEFEVLTSDLDTMRHEDLERDTYMRMGIEDTVSSLLYNEFRVTESRKVPYAYALDNRSGSYDHIVENLRLHGIAVDTVAREEPVEVRRFRVSDFSRGREYEGHELITAEGSFRTEEVSLEDWLIIPTNSSNRQLTFYLLEPESDDGYVKWGLFNRALESGGPFPVVKIASPGALSLE